MFAGKLTEAIAGSRSVGGADFTPGSCTLCERTFYPETAEPENPERLVVQSVPMGCSRIYRPTCCEVLNGHRPTGGGELIRFSQSQKLIPLSHSKRARRFS
jgi:hypothetical protein